MKRTPEGTPVGVDDPYEYAGVCDHLTDDGRCRYALEYPDHDPSFTQGRRSDDYACLVADCHRDWSDCPHYRSTADGRECLRCGLQEVRLAHDNDQPLVEEHHLSYGNTGGQSGSTEPENPSHEITVTLCRWCHAKVHRGVARIDDDGGKDPEAIAERERRRKKELDELGFESAADRFDGR